MSIKNESAESNRGLMVRDPAQIGAAPHQGGYRQSRDGLIPRRRCKPVSRDVSDPYFNSMITALAEPRTTSSVWMRSRLLKRISPDLYSFTTALPFGSGDWRGGASR